MIRHLLLFYVFSGCLINANHDVSWTSELGTSTRIFDDVESFVHLFFFVRLAIVEQIRGEVVDATVEVFN